MRTTTADIQQLYEEHDAELYNDFPSLVNGLREHLDRVHHVTSLLKRLAPRTLLDVGCNRGLFGTMAKRSHDAVPLGRVVGIDISRMSAEHAHRMGYDFVFVLNASEPFDIIERFDAALCMEIIEHVPNPVQVIENVAKHLLPGGAAIFSCPEEQEALDGEFHVRNVSLEGLKCLVAEVPSLNIVDSYFLPSEFCEKPKWQGWNYVLAVKKP